MQATVEEEVTELLGRGKSERRQAVDAARGYRNGYGQLRKLTLGCGTITVGRWLGTEGKAVSVHSVGLDCSSTSSARTLPEPGHAGLVPP